MNMVCFSGAMPSSPILSISALSDALRPRTLPTGTSLPSLDVCMTGLIESIVPSSADVALTRPPRLR